MNILYYSNPDIKDMDLILNFLKLYGDNVIFHTDRVTLDVIEKNNIEFIVSDRARFLIREPVLSLLSKRIVNLHPSYLPYNRGYFPNFWSFIDGTPQGVTVHYIDAEIDTGNVIAQKQLEFSDNDTLRTSYEITRQCMAALFMEYWVAIKEQRCPSLIQPIEGTIHYKKDFDGVFEQLPHGWDTKIKDIKAIFSAANSLTPQEVVL